MLVANIFQLLVFYVAGSFLKQVDSVRAIRTNLWPEAIREPEKADPWNIHESLEPYTR